MTIVMTRRGAEFWWNLNRKDKMIIPPEVASYTRDHPYQKWKVTTWKDAFAERKRKQLLNLDYKKRCGIKKIKPCYVWVFYNESWIYGGWWIYIKTLKDDFAINFKHQRNDKLIIKAMKMFPCGIIPIIENFDKWAELFSKEYHSNSFKRKIQGLKICKCVISEYGELEDILFMKE